MNQLLIAVVLMATVGICGVWSTLITWEMVERLNKALPIEQQFDPLWWGPLKRRRFLKAYEQVFPNDPVRKRLRLSVGLMFACLVAAVIDLGIL